MAGSTSATDRALVELIRMGKVDAEIAVRLGLSAGVIEDRVTSICNDAGFTSRAELVASRGDLRPAVVLQADPPEQRRFALTAVLSLVTTLAICAVAAWMFVPRPAGESSATYALATANLTTPSFVPLPADTSVINGVRIQDAVIGVPEYLPAGITLLILRTDAASGTRPSSAWPRRPRGWLTPSSLRQQLGTLRRPLSARTARTSQLRSASTAPPAGMAPCRSSARVTAARTGRR